MDCQYCQGASARLKSSDPEENQKIEKARSGHVVFERGELIDADLQRGNHVYIVAEGLASCVNEQARPSATM